MSGLDWLMIALYFGLLLGLTWWSVLRNRNTADDYFLAGRNLGWVVVGASIIGLWCTDQYIVQRTLGAPNEKEARRGTIFTAFLKLLPVFIFIVPGMIALALARSGKVPGLGVCRGPSSSPV